MRSAILVAAAASALGQPGVQPYSGTWVAERAGKAYVRLELNATDGTLGGSIRLADIQFDSQGEVSTIASELAGPAPVVDITIQDSTLSLSRKGDSETDRFEMKLVGDAAELRFIPSDADRQELAEIGIPVPKPFRLRKLAP